MESVFQPQGERRCGGCSLCCKLLPIKGLKKAGAKCNEQRFKGGCKIYSDRPRDCRLWSCRWLTDPDTKDLRRPDRVHYTIDPMLDFVSLECNTAETAYRMPVLQVWVDPKHPDAYKDDGLRSYLKRMANEKGIGALIRYGPREGFLLLAPCEEHEEWLEMKGTPEGREHTAEEVLDWAYGARK